jgi:hypothetical protein
MCHGGCSCVHVPPGEDFDVKKDQEGDRNHRERSIRCWIRLFRPLDPTANVAADRPEQAQERRWHNSEWPLRARFLLASIWVVPGDDTTIRRSEMQNGQSLQVCQISFGDVGGILTNERHRGTE